jgi:hypothetical protein
MSNKDNLLGTMLSLPSDSPLERLSILDVYVMVTGLSAITHPRGSGHYMVRCPVKDHEDKHPSCLLNQSTDSWKCFSGGEKGGKLDLVIAAGIAKDRPSAAEFLRARSGKPIQAIDQPPEKSTQRRGPIEKLENERLTGTYEYFDETGKLLYEYLRYEGTGVDGGRDKRFVGKAPDGKGGWKYNLAGIRRVPYRLPQLVAARDAEVKQSILVVEGEKHADVLGALKFVATTNAGGTSYEWPLSWAKHFSGGSRILLIPDADAPGRKAMRQRETLLKNSGLRVFFVDLYPDRNDGSDILDWMKEQGLEKLPKIEQRKKIIEKLSGYCSAQENDRA